MKRNHARVQHEDAKVLAAEKVELPEDDLQLDTEDAHSDDEGPLIFNPTASQNAKPPQAPQSKPAQPFKSIKPVATHAKEPRRTLEDQPEDIASPQDVSAFFDHRVDGLYIILISLHGLVRGQQMELGKDPDTGGQVSNKNVCLTNTPVLSSQKPCASSGMHVVICFCPRADVWYKACAIRTSTLRSQMHSPYLMC